MSLANSLAAHTENSNDVHQTNRRAATGTDPCVFTAIYDEAINLVIWQRDLSVKIQSAVSHFSATNPGFQTAMTVSPERVSSSLGNVLDATAHSDLVQHIAELVDMFCCLFSLSRTGLRLTVLDKAMCPKFHVDRVPCRLITTFQGRATEWLPHNVVDRTKLGAGSHGLKDGESGLYQHENDIQRLTCGDVALLKGELWNNNDNAGLVHRSPACDSGDRRLLLTLDFAD